MRKFLFTIITIILIMALTSCVVELVLPEDSETELAAAREACSTLNNLTQKKYERIELEINTKNSFANLSSNYVLTDSEVTYSIERLNLLPADGDITGMAYDYKNTISGSASVENGQITKLDGNDVTLPEYDQLTGCFNFNVDNMENVSVKNNRLVADIISPADFYGAEVEMEDLRITVEYTDSAIVEINISYKLLDTTVKTVYSFA